MESVDVYCMLRPHLCPSPGRRGCTEEGLGTFPQELSTCFLPPNIPRDKEKARPSSSTNLDASMSQGPWVPAVPPGAPPFVGSTAARPDPRQAKAPKLSSVSCPLFSGLGVPSDPIGARSPSEDYMYKVLPKVTAPTCITGNGLCPLTGWASLLRRPFDRALGRLKVVDPVLGHHFSSFFGFC